MEVSLVSKSPVNHRGNKEVPPPMVLISPSVLSMEYKWSVVSHPEVTRIPDTGVIAAKRSRIEHIWGYKLQN